jgi:integrase
VLLDAYASLRWSEAVAIKRDDLDLEARTVRIDETLGEVRGAWVWGKPKTVGSARTVDLPELLVKPLAAHLLRFPQIRDREDARFNGLIFTGERGGPIRRHSFREAWVDACTAAGLDVSVPSGSGTPARASPTSLPVT